MALFYYKCEEHGIFCVLLSTQKKEYECPKCNKKAKLQLNAGSVNVVEKIDNGYMPRAVTWIKDAPEVMRKRSKKNDNDSSLI